MAQVTFADGIESLWGAIDSVKEGKKNGYRVVVRRHDYGEGKNYDPEGRKWHELFHYHFHEGAWSDGATKNREMIKAAQRTAHDIERDPELRAEWEAKYQAYLATIKPGEKHYHFYNYVYVSIYREMRDREQGLSQDATEMHREAETKENRPPSEGDFQ